MSWDNSKISDCIYWLMLNIDSSLIDCINMASGKRDLWELFI